MQLRNMLLLIALINTGSSLASTTCYLMQTGETSTCWDYEFGSYCEVQPRYETTCYDWGDGTGDLPYTPPADPGIPTYVDPAYLYIEYIDDTDPNNIGVQVNADTRLDTFSLYSKGTNYGTAGGSGTVIILGLPATSFDAGSADISVDGCSSGEGFCAAWREDTSVWSSSASANGSVSVMWFNGAWSSYQRTHHVDFLVRDYSVWSAGGSRLTFLKSLSGLSYSTLVDEQVMRTETLRWNTAPGSFLAQSCAMTAEWVDVLNPPYTATDFVACDLAQAIGHSGSFSTRIDSIMKSSYSGIEFGVLQAGEDLVVTVP